jgi:Ca2+-binding RTX toxin-like protein
MGKQRAARTRRGTYRAVLEALEPRTVLDASFGFIAVPGGFVFQITGTDFQQSNETPDARADNMVIWTELAAGGGIAATNFFAEWVDNGGAWHSLSGGVTSGDVALEAARRGLQPSDFRGFEIRALGGNDEIYADGTGQIGKLKGAPAPLNVTPGDPGVGTSIMRAMIGQRLTIDGNGGDDRIFGSPEDDIIRGGSGRDQIRAGAGNDTVVAGPDDDDILGGSGSDTLEGGDGRDRILGEEGNDFIAGGPGDDGATDAAGGNLLTGWGLFGGPGEDTIDGGPGADDLAGGLDADKLIGGEGDDSLLGDNHDKSPEGGPGTDAWQAGSTTTGPIIIESSDLEKVDTTGANANEPTQKASNIIPGLTLAFRLINPGVAGPFDATGVGPFSFDDRIDLSGWTSDDVSGVQIITGGGNDAVVGSNVGSDVLQPGDGDDTAVGLGNRDYSNGGQGSDLISGGPGADEIDGGPEPPDDDVAQRDTVTYNEVTVGSKVFPGSPAGVNVSLTGGFGRGGDAEGDILRFLENVIGSELDDVIFGDVQHNRLEGRGGNDQLIGLVGNDELVGGDGDDLLIGGNSTLPPPLEPPAPGTPVPPLPPPDFGADILRGDKGNDRLFGEAGPDQLLGGPGDDLVDGGTEADDLSGGKGLDILVTEFGQTNLVDDFVFGNEDPDNFRIFGTRTSIEQFQVMSELNEKETSGESDFDNNEDFLEFV